MLTSHDGFTWPVWDSETEENSQDLLDERRAKMLCISDVDFLIYFTGPTSAPVFSPRWCCSPRGFHATIMQDKTDTLLIWTFPAQVSDIKNMFLDWETNQTQGSWERWSHQLGGLLSPWRMQVDEPDWIICVKDKGGLWRCSRLETTLWCCWSSWCCWPMTSLWTPSVNFWGGRPSSSLCFSCESQNTLRGCTTKWYILYYILFI